MRRIRPTLLLSLAAFALSAIVAIDRFTPVASAQLPHQALGDLITPSIWNTVVDAVNANTTVATNLSGAILFFNGSCPTGWTEYTSARGRYVVGVPSGGTLAGTVGATMTDLENRAHTGSSLRAGIVTDATFVDSNDSGSTYNNFGAGGSGGGSPSFQFYGYPGTSFASAGTPGVAAPYIQLRACQKS